MLHWSAASRQFHFKCKQNALSATCDAGCYLRSELCTSFRTMRYHFRYIKSLQNNRDDQTWRQRSKIEAQLARKCASYALLCPVGEVTSTSKRTKRKGGPGRENMMKTPRTSMTSMGHPWAKNFCEVKVKGSL